MSGVNRNILQNYSQPVLSANQLLLSNETTAGSRWLLLNFPILSLVSSSQGGDCNGITLEWTPDPSLASESSSSYYAVTSSVINCDATNLSPLTSSLGWAQFIDSTYNYSGSTPSLYYMRAYQNVTGGGRGPYSNVISVQTRSPRLYSGSMQSQGFQYTPAYNVVPSLNKPGITGSVVIFTPDSFNPTTGQLQTWAGDNKNVYVTGSTISGSLQIVKAGGPNYDAIKTNGATISFSLTGSVSGSGFEVNSIMDCQESSSIQPWSGSSVSDLQNFCATAAPYFNKQFASWTAGVSILTGSLEISGSDGYYLYVSATTSSNASSVSTVSGSTDTFPTGSSTINKIVGTRPGQSLCVAGNVQYYGQLRWNVNGVNLSPGTGSAKLIGNPTSSLGSTVTIRTSADCVFRTLSFGVLYESNLYYQQYGQ